MVDSNKHKCVICGKQQLNLEKYDDHMTFKHQISLQNPDLEEYDNARATYEYEHETCAPDSCGRSYRDGDRVVGSALFWLSSGNCPTSYQQNPRRKFVRPLITTAPRPGPLV